MNKIILTSLVIIILVLALFVRTTNLDHSPASINWDEASLGYSAYSILKTGRDEYGKFLPLSLRSFSDFKPALYAYADIPFIYIFGLNQASTRLASAVWGTISLIGIWLFLGIFVKNVWLRIICLLVISMEPWRIHFSRVALETNLSASIYIFGAYLLFRSKVKQGYLWKKILAATVILAISAYAYHSARMSGPALIILFLIDPLEWLWTRIKVQNIKNLKYLIFILLFGLLLMPIFIESRNGEVLARFKGENFFTRYYPYVPTEIFDNSISAWIGRSPVYYMTGMLLGRLTAYFSPVNFSTNVFHWIRNSVQYVSEFNMFGWIEIFFLILGIVLLVKNIRIFKYRYLLYWIIAAASPSVVTWNWFHALRFLNGMPAIEMLIVIGLISFLGKFKKDIFRLFTGIILVILFVWQTVFVINNELNYSVWENNGEFQPGGFKEGVPLLMKLAPKYDQIIIESPHAQSYIFFAFYGAYDPVRLQSYSLSRIGPGGSGTGSFNFDKFVFRKVNWNEDQKLRNTILWFPSIINKDQVDAVPYAKVYYFINPVGSYNSAMMVTLD
jgi:hypothetical protein